MRRGHLAAGGEVIDDLRQVLAEPFQEFVAGEAELRGERVDLVGAQRRAEVLWGDRVVLAGTDPGFRDLAMAAVLELLEEVVEAAAQDRPGGPTGEQSAEPALEQVERL